MRPAPEEFAEAEERPGAIRLSSLDPLSAVANAPCMLAVRTPGVRGPVLTPGTSGPMIAAEDPAIPAETLPPRPALTRTEDSSAPRPARMPCPVPPCGAERSRGIGRDRRVAGKGESGSAASGAREEKDATMDGFRFDNLARAVAAGTSRRSVLKGLAATLAAAWFPIGRRGQHGPRTRFRLVGSVPRLAPTPSAARLAAPSSAATTALFATGQFNCCRTPGACTADFHCCGGAVCAGGARAAAVRHRRAVARRRVHVDQRM